MIMEYFGVDWFKMIMVIEYPTLEVKNLFKRVILSVIINGGL